MLHCNQTIAEFFDVKWEPNMVEGLDVEIRQSKHQTFWEFLALLLSMVIWGHYFKAQAVAVVGGQHRRPHPRTELGGEGHPFSDRERTHVAQRAFRMGL